MINSYVLDVLSAIQLMILLLYYVIRCIDVTLNIRYMLWGMYHMLAKRQVVVPL
jgi:hypothetical protein